MNTLTFLASAALLCASALLPGIASAEVYQWVDGDGRVHYTDKPVDLSARELPVRSARTDPARVEAAQQALVEEREQREEGQREAEEQQRKAAEQNARRTQNCARARERLAYIQEAQRPYRVSPDGERQYLSSEEIDATRVEAIEDVQEWCD